MRITYIHQHFALPSEAGGSRPYEFTRRLAADGHEVTVIGGSAESSDQIINGVRILRVGAAYNNAMSFGARVAAFLTFMLKASFVSARLSSDLVFASSTPLTAAVPALITRLVRRVPMVFEVRDLWPELPIALGALRNPVLIRLARFLEYLSYRSSARVIALSPWMEEGVKSVAPGTKTALVPNASDFERFELADDERLAERQRRGWEGKVVIVYAGSFGASYELNWLVKLASELDDRYRVVIYGGGASTTELERLARDSGLEPSSLLPGRVSKEEVAKAVAASDAVISCLSEVNVLKHNSLNKVFDGLAAGRPILLNHDGWLQELVTSYGAGMQLSRDLNEARVQLRLLCDASAVEKMGENARRLGRERFDRDVLYSKFSNVLVEAAKARS